MKLVVNGTDRPPAPDRALIAAIVQARDWANRLISGEVATMAEICAAEGLSDSYVGRLLPLAFLAPSIVEDILAGTQPATRTANGLTWGGELPLCWEEQAVRHSSR